MPPEQIEETHALLADLGSDSLDIIEITMEVEEHFDISVPDDQEQDVRTVRDIVDGVLRLLGQRRDD
ncbi:MAG: phosphopantetheine-binding protein [Planctomycetia bacterium]|nr:phosphopantetheine-binding protein [Planctomycetia bacterium]